MPTACSSTAVVSVVHVYGFDLQCVEEGAGVPVLFSHGSGSDLRYWEPQRRPIGTRFRFVAFSRRFHGTGMWPAEGDYSTDAHVKDLLAIAQGLRAGPVHLVGFSTNIALRAALREPDLFRSLTIIEPNVPWLLEGTPEGEAVLASWREQNARVRAEAGDDELRRAALWFELVNNRGRGTFAAQPEDLQRMWLDNFATRRPSPPAQDPLTCAELSAIRVPTLALGAEYGMQYSRRILDRVAACIPQSRLVIIDGATHFMSYQMPETFNAVLLDFIAEH